MRSRPIFAAILGLTVLASWAAAEAQQSVKMARIGFLYFGSREPGPGAALHAVVLFGDTFFAQQVREIANVALKHRLPSVFILQDYADAGGLMTFGAPIIDNFRRAAPPFRSGTGGSRCGVALSRVCRKD